MNPNDQRNLLRQKKKLSNVDLVRGKKYIVLGDMLELGKTSKNEHTSIGKLIRKMKFENLLTFGNDSRNTFIGAKGLKNNYHFQDKDTLAQFLNIQLKKGDLVLVKGSRSMKMEDVIAKISLN